MLAGGALPALPATTAPEEVSDGDEADDDHTYLEFGDDGGHDIENFGISRVRNIAIVVDQDRIEQRWHDAIVDHVHILGFLNKGVDEFQNLLLHRTQPSNLGHLCCNGTYEDVLVPAKGHFIVRDSPSRSTASEII